MLRSCWRNKDETTGPSFLLRTLVGHHTQAFDLIEFTTTPTEIRLKSSMENKQARQQQLPEANAGLSQVKQKQGWSTIRIHGGRGMCSWAGREIEWKRMSTSWNAIRPYLKTRQERKKERERKATGGAPPLGFAFCLLNFAT